MNTLKRRRGGLVVALVSLSLLAGSCGGGDDDKELSDALAGNDGAEVVSSESSPAASAGGAAGEATQAACTATLTATGAVSANASLRGRVTLDAESDGRPAAFYALTDGELEVVGYGFVDPTKANVQIRSGESTYELAGSAVTVKADGSGISAAGVATAPGGEDTVQFSLEATCS